MQEFVKLYEYVKANYSEKCFSVTYNNCDIIIVFHNELSIRITFNNYYKIYVNDIFYYNIDEQDIIDTVKDIFSEKYFFCKIKGICHYKIKIIPLTKYIDANHIIGAWTIKQTLKS